MSGADQDFADWIGRTEAPPPDSLTPRLVNTFKATFASVLPPDIEVPLGLHWCLFVPSVPEAGLGADGHPAKGGFLPPIPLPRRMWAGGEIEFLDAFAPGDEVTKRSEITGVTRKAGRSGDLFFVAVTHQYRVGNQTVLRERQDIVYRATAEKMLEQPAPAPDIPTFAYQAQIDITPITLFRYSALTFNAHRIHYDLAYAQEQELYPDLVIHGPLQATALLNVAAGLKGKAPAQFSYRGVAPALGPQSLTLGAEPAQDGVMDLVVLNAAGHRTMEAKAVW